MSKGYLFFVGTKMWTEADATEFMNRVAEITIEEQLRNDPEIKALNIDIKVKGVMVPLPPP